jgi:putative transposase
VFRDLAEQKESRIVEGHLMVDHVHMRISITAETCGVSGGGVHQGEEFDSPGASLRSAETALVSQHFWVRGYFVSTVGRDEKLIRRYIRNQEEEDRRLDQLDLWR